MYCQLLVFLSTSLFALQCSNIQCIVFTIVCNFVADNMSRC